jgi:hypothetical protein
MNAAPVLFRGGCFLCFIRKGVLKAFYGFLLFGGMR